MSKKLVSLLALVTTLQWSYAQTTAVDWTLTDCASNNYNLYSILDSQEVVVMEFSHGCASCTNAASYLMNIKAQYDILHPGKVNWFFMDYNGNNCSTVNAMIAPYSFDAAFINCQVQKDHYYPSIFPMPAIVIAAGNYHTVIFQNNTWLNSDTAAIKTALDHFFATVGVEEENNSKLNVYPNPVQTTLTIELDNDNMSETLWRITDMVGKEQEATILEKVNKSVTVDVSKLKSGNYIIEMVNQGTALRKIFVKS